MKKILTFMVLWFLIFELSTGQVTKEDATKLVFNYIHKHEWKDCLVYQNKDIMRENSEIHTIDERINTPNEPSIAFFIDKYPLANWSHSCAFLFVNIKNGDIKIIEYKWPPVDLHNWQFLNELKGQIPEKVITLPVTEFIQNKTLVSSDHCYAVIISGGGVPGTNYSRYWNDCSFIYSTLVDVFNFQDSNIKCLISDGTSSNVDRRIGYYSYDSSPLDLDGDSDNDIDYAATKSNITTVFNSLSSVIGGDDHLFIFITDHGTQESGQDVRIILWGEGEYITDDEFADEVDKINAAQISLVMGQCYSGGLIDDLAASDRVIATACDYDEVSYAMGTYTYNEFVFDWISAMAGEDPYENSVDADDNNDGFISFEEAFDYAEANDAAAETPQYYSNPDELGYVLGLGFSLAILGPSYVCYSGTEFSFDGIPARDTIIWSSCGDISRVSSQGANPCEFDTEEVGDYGWIDAIISNDGRQYNVANKVVWLDKPDPYIVGNEEVECYTPEWYFVDNESMKWGDYLWSTDYNMEIVSTTTGHKAEAQGLDEGYGQIFVEVTNACGSNENRLVVYVSCSRFMLSPNPASEFVTISRTRQSRLGLKKPDNDLAALDYSIQIVDFYGNLHFSGIGSGDSFTVPVSNLKNGNYYIKINDRKEEFNLKLIVKH